MARILKNKKFRICVIKNKQMKQYILLGFTALLLFSCSKEVTDYTRTKNNFGSDWTFTKDSTSLNWEKITVSEDLFIKKN